MKDFIYQLIDFMWFWTPDNTRDVLEGDAPNTEFREFLFWIYIIFTILPILVGTIARLGIDYSNRLPFVSVNNNRHTFEGKLLNQLITGYIIENILFWLIFNTVLLAVPFVVTVVIFLLVICLRGFYLGDRDTDCAKFTLTLKYLTTRLIRKAKDGALNDIKKAQDNYLTIEKEFLDELTSYKNESSSNLLSAGVN